MLESKKIYRGRGGGLVQGIIVFPNGGGEGVPKTIFANFTIEI